MRNSRCALTYGRRGGQRGVDAGVRRVAPTFGKKQFLTYSAKSIGHFLTESDAERLVSHILTLAPSVRSFLAQPFTVDLIDGVVLHDREAIASARAKHRVYGGHKFYTPDFSVDWKSSIRSAVEVKLEGFLGDLAYESKLAVAKPILERHGYRLSKVVVPSGPEHPLRTNVALLTKAARRLDLLPKSERLADIQAGIGSGKVTLAQLCERYSISPNVVPVMLFKGVVAGDLASRPIGGDLMLEAADGALDHLELFEAIQR